jgi:type IV secretory pathway component VirB8
VGTGKEHEMRDTRMWTTIRRELLEIVWLASIVGALSILAVAAAVALVATVPILAPQV